MKIDLNVYAANRPFIQDYYRKNMGEEISPMLSIWSGSTMCPCIALAFYIAEDIGYTPELIRLIDIFIKCYGYTEIQNQLPGSPYIDKKSIR